LNWDAHRYSAAVASNCWKSDKSASELGWSHKDDSLIADRPLCRGVWEGAVLPDSRELWKECSSKLKAEPYMTPSCPPPPPYHHRKMAVEFANYYWTLARKSYLSGREEDAGRFLGIALHYAADELPVHVARIVASDY